MIFSFYFLTTNSQKVIGNYYPYFLDEPIIDVLRDSLLKSGINELFVFQTNIDSIEDINLVNTYLLWNDNLNGYVKKINDSAIFKTQKYLKFNFFKYSNLLNTVILDKYDKPYKFVVPVFDYRNRFIIYSDKTKIFSFPSGNFDIQFTEDKTRHLYKKELADKIEKEVLKYDDNNKIENKYKRLDLFSGNDSINNLVEKAHDKYFKK